MNAYIVLKIVLVFHLYVYIRDDQKHLVEAKPEKRMGYSLEGTENDLVDELPFWHGRARRSLRFLKEHPFEFDGRSDDVSSDPHFSIFAEDSSHYREQEQNYLPTDSIDTYDSDIRPMKHIRRKSKKLTKEKTAEKKRKGKKKKMHKKKLFQRGNLTNAKVQPFDIVVHIKVNEK